MLQTRCSLTNFNTIFSNSSEVWYKYSVNMNHLQFTKHHVTIRNRCWLQRPWIKYIISWLLIFLGKAEIIQNTSHQLESNEKCIFWRRYILCITFKSYANDARLTVHSHNMVWSFSPLYDIPNIVGIDFSLNIRSIQYSSSEIFTVPCPPDSSRGLSCLFFFANSLLFVDRLGFNDGDSSWSLGVAMFDAAFLV